MEMILVIAIIGILASVAVPPMLNMRQGLEYRQAARAVSSVLRDARNRAIRDNRQYRVELEPVAPCRRYAITEGDRAYDSQNWTPTPIPANSWISLPQSVTLTTTQANFAFNPNGTAANVAAGGVTINIRDSNNATRLSVQVTPIGKIAIM